MVMGVVASAPSARCNTRRAACKRTRGMQAVRDGGEIPSRSNALPVGPRAELVLRRLGLYKIYTESEQTFTSMAAHGIVAHLLWFRGPESCCNRGENRGSVRGGVSCLASTLYLADSISTAGRPRSCEHGMGPTTADLSLLSALKNTTTLALARWDLLPKERH